MQIEIPAHPTEDHRLGDGALLGPKTKVDVHHDQPNQSDAGQPVQYVQHAPSQIAEQIRIAGKENRAHAKHHEYSAYDRGQTRDHDGPVVELVLERVLREFVGRRRGLSHKAQNSSHGVPGINPVRPDGPEVQEERGVNDMKEYGEGENGPCNPVIADPVEPDAHLREKGGKQQREHGGGHNPVKQPRGERMSWYVRRYSSRDQ